MYIILLKLKCICGFHLHENYEQELLRPSFVVVWGCPIWQQDACSSWVWFLKPFSSVYTCSREHLFLVPWKTLLQRDDGRLVMESLKRSQCSQLLYLVLVQFVSQSVLFSLSYLVFALNSLPRPWLVVSTEPPVQETFFLIDCKEVIDSALMGGKRFHSLKSDLNIAAILSGLVMARHWHFWSAINKCMTLLFEDHSLFALYDWPSLSGTISASVNLLTKIEFRFKVHLHVFSNTHANFLMQIPNLQTCGCEWLPLPKFLCETMPLPTPNPHFCNSQISLLLLSYNPLKLEKIVQSVNESLGQAILFILLQNSIKEINWRALLTHMHTPKRDFNYQLLQIHPQTSQDRDLSILELHPKDQFQRRNFL